MPGSPLELQVLELEKQLQALLEVVKVDPAGNVEIKNKSGASISLSGPTVNVNKGALEVV